MQQQPHATQQKKTGASCGPPPLTARPALPASETERAREERQRRLGVSLRPFSLSLSPPTNPTHFMRPHDGAASASPSSPPLDPLVPYLPAYISLSLIGGRES
jgi:hypothetical protein